jgi:hypothetical protein
LERFKHEALPPLNATDCFVVVMIALEKSPGDSFFAIFANCLYRKAARAVAIEKYLMDRATLAIPRADESCHDIVKH